jgi:hypothetical protein
MTEHKRVRSAFENTSVKSHTITKINAKSSRFEQKRRKTKRDRKREVAIIVVLAATNEGRTTHSFLVVLFIVDVDGSDDDKEKGHHCLKIRIKKKIFLYSKYSVSANYFRCVPSCVFFPCGVYWC